MGITLTGKFNFAGTSLYTPGVGILPETTFFLKTVGGVVTDVTGNNTLSQYNVQVSTQVHRPSKPDSISFADANAFISCPNVADRFTFGTGDFTVEAWVNRVAHYDPYQSIVSVASDQPQFGNPYGFGWGLSMNQSLNPGMILFNNNNQSDVLAVWGSTPLTPGQWYHIAGVRQGNQLNYYQDGVLTASATIPNGFTIAPNPDTLLNISTYASGAWGHYFGGYIDSAIITRGIAKYTGNFTPV